MASALRSLIDLGGEPVPFEYVEFLFCREFKCLPKDLEAMDSTTFHLWQGFLNAEREAARMKSLHKDLYGR